MSKNSVTKNTVKLFLVFCFSLERSVKTRQTLGAGEQGLNCLAVLTSSSALLNAAETSAAPNLLGRAISLGLTPKRSAQ
jgi:hypothetical protein